MTRDERDEGETARLHGTRKPARRAAGRVPAALLAALAIVVFGAGFVRFASSLQTTETPPVGHADALVVLTGGADRVADAIDLLANGRADRLLITGVNTSTSPESLARRHPRIRNLVDCCVTLGYGALDTTGNAAETAAWAKANHIRSLIVVTSNYHMPRALAEIGNAIGDVTLLPYPVVADAGRDSPWWLSPHRLRLIASEYVKYIVVVMRQTLGDAHRREAPGLVAARDL